MALQIWTVYERPSDYPACYVARLFLDEFPTDALLVSGTLDGLRQKLPPGLYCMPRAEGDEPQIVECWL